MRRRSSIGDTGSGEPLASAGWRAAVGVGAVLGSEFLLRDVLLPSEPSDAEIRYVIAGEWLTLGGLLCWWVPHVERAALTSIGGGPFRWRHVWEGAGAFALAVGASAASGKALTAVGLPTVRTLQPVLRRYRGSTRAALFITGTVLEEILYRGYVMDRLIQLTRRPWIAGLIDWLAFSGAHLKFFGPGPTLDVGPLSATLILLYARERTLWPVMVLHGLNDALAFIVAPLLPTPEVPGDHV